MRIFFDLSFLHRTTTKIYINKFFEKRDCKDLCKNICFKVSNMRHIAFGLLKEYEKIFILKEQIKSRMDYYRMALSWTSLVCVCVLKECRDKNDIWPYRLILAVSQTVWNNSLCFDIVFLYYFIYILYILFVAFKQGKNNIIICTHRVVFKNQISYTYYLDLKAII